MNHVIAEAIIISPAKTIADVNHAPPKPNPNGPRSQDITIVKYVLSDTVFINSPFLFILLPRLFGYNCQAVYFWHSPKQPNRSPIKAIGKMVKPVNAATSISI